MRSQFVGVLALSCLALVARTAAADDLVEGKAVVDKAIKALGGEEKLRKFKGLEWKFKGKFDADGITIELKMDGSAQGSDRWKLEVEATVNGQSHGGLLILNGDKGWTKEGATGKVEAIPGDAIELVRGDFYALALALNPSLLLEKDCQLSPLGETKVDGQPAVGVRVSKKGRPDVSVYFDKQKGLPVKCELQVKEPDNQEKGHEFRFSAPKEAGGIKFFSKLVLFRDGKSTLDGELTDHKPVEKFEDSTFDKP